MTEAQFRKAALSHPGVSESPHFERTSFRAGTKIFATMTRAGDEAMIRVRPRDKLEALLQGQPDVFFSYGGWTDRFGSLGIRLRPAPVALVRQLIRDAFEDVTRTGGGRRSGATRRPQKKPVRRRIGRAGDRR
jgi:hypothetical protein